jgi:type IV fimbrial biogenesis protein FimT
MEIGMKLSFRSRSSLGFTLIEMMIVVAVVAILASLAAPSLSTFVASQRVKTASFDLYSSMMFARSEAIKRRSNVYVRAKDGALWTSGWDVSTDLTGSNASTLRSQGDLNGISMTLSPAATVSFYYKMDGRLSNSNIVVTLASTVNSDLAGKRCFTFDATGIPRSYKLTSGSTCT